MLLALASDLQICQEFAMNCCLRSYAQNETLDYRFSDFRRKNSLGSRMVFATTRPGNRLLARYRTADRRLSQGEI
jgi:hypothetical protein